VRLGQYSEHLCQGFVVVRKGESIPAISDNIALSCHVHHSVISPSGIFISLSGTLEVHSKDLPVAAMEKPARACRQRQTFTPLLEASFSYSGSDNLISGDRAGREMSLRGDCDFRSQANCLRGIVAPAS
jgi:hypothetical protein